MATVTKGRTFVSGEVVTPTKLNTLVDSATVTQIVNADIDAAAAIVDTKLATIATAGKVANSATTATAGGTVLSVSSITRSGSVATVTTAIDHGFTTDNLVNLRGAKQDEYNGQFPVASVPTTTTFTVAITGTPVTPATGTLVAVNAEASAISVSSISRSGATATITTGSAHGVGVGESINIRGASQTEYNGLFTVVSAPTTTTITVTVSGAPVTPATGTIFLRRPSIVARDASGNFSAGTITANLTGNVTGTATGLADIGSKFLPKAWLNFQGNLGAITPNTYSQSYNATTNITTVTVNTTKSGGHGLSTGDFITITASTSGVVNGTWQVNVISSGTLTFSVAGTLAATVASATINPILLRSSINVARVQNLGTGIYQVDFGTSASVSITALSCSGTTATATAANTLSVGSFITVTGASIAGYNGTFQVTAAAASSFSYTVTSSMSAATTATGVTTVAGAIFADANYVTTGSVRYQSTSGSRMGLCSDSRTVSSTRILTNYYDGTAYDMFEVSAVFFGNW